MKRRCRYRALSNLCVTVIVLALLPPFSAAQDRGFEITPTYGYMWNGSIATSAGDLRFTDGQQVGAIIGYPTTRNTLVELSWLMNSSTATFDYYGYTPGVPPPNSPELDDLEADITFHYFQLSGIQEFPKGNVRPFFGAGAGAMLAHPSDAKYTDEWRFSISLSGGVKIMMSERIGLRLHGRLLLPIYFSGGGVWVGTGGASVGVSGGVPMVQGDAGAGLIFVL